MERPVVGGGMKFWLPYSYRVEHVPKNRVRPKYDIACDYVEGDVPMISKSDTGLAASLTYVIRRPTGENVLPYEFRTWNGDIIVKVRDDNEPDVATEWLPTGPDIRSSRPRAYSAIYGFNLSHFGEGEHILKLMDGDMRGIASFDSIKAKGRVVSSNKADEMALVQSIADSFVSLDGELWRKTAYAGLFVDMREEMERGSGKWANLIPESHGYSVHHTFSEAERRRYPGWRRGFDVTEAERLIHHANTGIEWAFRDLDVVDAEALAFDGEKHFIVNAMDYAVLNTWDQVGDMGGECLTAWTMVRDAVERVRNDRYASVSDADVEAFRVLASSVQGEIAFSIRTLLVICDEYLDDDWSRLGQRQDKSLAKKNGI